MARRNATRLLGLGALAAVVEAALVVVLGSGSGFATATSSSGCSPTAGRLRPRAPTPAAPAAGFATSEDRYAMPRITVFGLTRVDGFAEAMRSRGEGVGA